MNRPLLTTLSSRAPIIVTVSLGQPGFLNNVILYPVRPRYLGDASDRNQSSSSQSHGVNNYFSSQSPVQRLSIYDWNPRHRRGREDAFEKQIAGKWHVVTLQEASDYVDHDILPERFHVTHLCGLRDSLQQGHLLP